LVSGEERSTNSSAKQGKGKVHSAIVFNQNTAQFEPDFEQGQQTEFTVRRHFNDSCVIPKCPITEYS